MSTNFIPIEKIKASDQVAEKLLKYILHGGVASGDKLPPERTLAAQFHVTRTTLREALKKLEQLKLIDIRQGQGIVVADLHTASLDLLLYLLVVDDKIDLNILENILEARALFGTDVARLAAKRADKNDIDRMDRLMETLIQVRDPAELQLLDFEFFRLLAMASKNIVYILLVNMLKGIHKRHINLFLPLTSELNTSLQPEILEAVRAGDEATAAEKAGQFLSAGIELLKSLKSI